MSFLEEKPAVHYMNLALAEARKALEVDEVPVGAVIVDRPTGRVIGRAHNQRELLQDPTAHAELVAITQAAAHYGTWRLNDADLYVTLEPCLMCSGAIVLARLGRVFYGTDDPKSGAYRSAFDVLCHPKNNHRPEVFHGIRAPESAELLSNFFRSKRSRPSNGSQ